MAFSFNSFHVFVTQSINPVFLLNRNLSIADFDNWKVFFSNEGYSMRLQMLDVLLGPGNDNDKRAYLSGIQKQLVMMSDLINQYLFRDKKIWAANNNALLIKVNYIHTLSLIEEILDFSFLNFEAYYNKETKITAYSIKSAVPELRSGSFKLKLHLQDHEISSDLINMLINGINSRINIQRLSLNNINYINSVINAVHKLPLLNDESLISLLIKLNFNQPDFYFYVTDLMNQRLLDINGLHEQKEVLLQQNQELKDLGISSELSLHPTERDLKGEILEFYSEKSIYIDDLMALRRVAMQDKYDSEQAFRMMVTLTVPQVALFFRVLMESGVLAKKRKTDVYNFVAHHFYNDKTVFFSGHNLLRRSTDIEFSTALKLWDVLSDMMKWLDEQFSILNYQRSL